MAADEPEINGSPWYYDCLRLAAAAAEHNSSLADPALTNRYAV